MCVAVLTGKENDIIAADFGPIKTLKQNTPSAGGFHLFFKYNIQF